MNRPEAAGEMERRKAGNVGELVERYDALGRRVQEIASKFDPPNQFHSLRFFCRIDTAGLVPDPGDEIFEMRKRPAKERFGGLDSKTGVSIEAVGDAPEPGAEGVIDNRKRSGGQIEALRSAVRARSREVEAQAQRRLAFGEDHAAGFTGIDKQCLARRKSGRASIDDVPFLATQHDFQGQAGPAHDRLAARKSGKHDLTVRRRRPNCLGQAGFLEECN